MPEKVDLRYATSLPPEKAIEYFTSKGHVISWDYRDTWGEAHAKAFTVAKATRMDVLQSIREELTKSVSTGTTERDFIKALTPRLQALGWWGKQEVLNEKTGELVQAQLGSPRRLKTIYRTNLQSAYMGARWKQMYEMREERPYWMWVAVLDRKTRPAHAALSGLVFRYDDPFWSSHWPPLTYNCRCRVRALSQMALDRKGLTVDSSEGNLRTEEVVINKTTGETKPVTVYTNPRTKASTSPDPGFNFNQGQAAWQPDLKKYDYDIARQYVKGAVTGPDFARFFTGKVCGTFPVAVLDKTYQEAIGAKTQAVQLSDQTMTKQIKSHPELELAEYQLIPDVVAEAQVIVQDGENTIAFTKRGDRLYHAVVKATRDGEELYLTSFRRTDMASVKRVMKKGKVLRNEF